MPMFLRTFLPFFDIMKKFFIMVPRYTAVLVIGGESAHETYCFWNPVSRL
ncbi:MAG: hypothetical protein PHE53_07180 [Thermoguttaceae bacterium]|nr:hypothetical protein [Thermoguttaceae bacterium]